MGEDIKRGLRESAQRGFFTGSRPPWGLHKVAAKDGSKTRYKLQPKPEQSVEVRTVIRIFTLSMNGTGCKEIARTMNREGFRTGTGRHWTKTTVHKILNNEAYCGTLVWGGRPEHVAIHSGIPPVRVENAWLAIIDKGVFHLVQQRMAANAPKATHPRTVPSFYILSGLLFCSCGHAMVGR